MTTAGHPRLERRDVMVALAAMAGLTLAAPRTLLADPSLMGMTHPLCGVNPINPDTAQDFYDVLTEELGADKLQALAGVVKNNPGDGMTKAITDAGLDDVAERVIEVFYTGIVTKNGDKVVIHYVDTLQWEAMLDFTKPPSRCGAEFGFWNFAPDL